jgi:hypothetical protein
MVKNRLFWGVVMSLFFLIGCEKIKEALTTVSGTVNSNNCKVVLAVKGEGGLLDYLSKVDSLDSQSLGDPDLFRGFDMTVENDGDYSITMFSFGGTYIVAVNDDGEKENRLDTLDHLGFYGELDTVIIPNVDTFIYSTPNIINVEGGVDLTDINVENMIQFRWFKIIWEMQ